MQRTFRALIFFFLTIHYLNGNGAVINKDSLRYEILLTSKTFTVIPAADILINSIAITPNRYILISSTNQHYILAWGGIKSYGNKISWGNLSSFAITPDSLLMTIRNNELCKIDSVGNLSKLLQLPNSGMGIFSGQYVIYLYDRNKTQTKFGLYALARGAKYTKVFEIPTPINSVAEIDNAVLFSTIDGLFRFTPKNNDLKKLIPTKADKEIISVTTNPKSNRIYFSTKNAIYSMKDSSVTTITNKFGGILKFFNDGLIVFNPEKKSIIRIVGIENEIKLKIRSESGKK